MDGGVTFYPWLGTLSLGALAAGRVRTILIRASVALAASGRIINSAVVSSTTPDPDFTNNTDTNITDVITPAFADIALTKTAQPAVAQPSQLLSYTVTVINRGPDEAKDVLLYDEAPPELSGVEFSVDGGVTWHVWSNPYKIGALAAGEQIIIFIRGRVSENACGTISNTAVAVSAVPDPNPDNNTATVDTPFEREGADLSIQKTVSPNPACRCQFVTFRLRVANAGPAQAQRVVLSDRLPRDLSRAVYSTDNGRTWHKWEDSYTVGALDAGASVSILVAGFVRTCARGSFCNTASVSSATADPDLSNNTACITVRVR